MAKKCGTCGAPAPDTNSRFCDLCGAPLTDEESSASQGLPVCPVCGFVYVPEELALGKVLSVEKALEDK